MKYKKIFILSIVLLSLLLAGCSQDDSQHKNNNHALTIKKITVTPKVVKEGESINLEVELANENSSEYNYNWKTNKGKGLLKPNGKEAIYTAKKVGRYKIGVLVKNNAGKEIYGEKEIKVIKGIAANYSNEVCVDNGFEITGSSPSEIKKIKVKVDGYYLRDEKTGKKEVYPTENGEYKLEYIFDTPKRDRKLVIEAYDKAGKLIDKIEDTIDVLKKEATITADYEKELFSGEEFNLIGKVDKEEVKKIKVKVDGYYLTDKESGNKGIMPGDNGNYSLTYVFDTAKENRKIVIEAYDKAGGLIDKIEDTIDVLKKEPTITADYSTELFLGEEFDLIGKVDKEEVKKIKVKVDGYYLTDKKSGNKEIVPDDNGNYNLTYVFDDASQGRKLIIEAYDSKGNRIDKIEDTISILKVKDRINVNLPKQIVVDESFNITGKALHPISQVSVAIDGYNLVSKSKIKNRKYEFNKVVLNTTGKDRNLVIKGYNKSGELITKLNKKITVFSNETLTIDMPSKIKTEEKITIKGQALNPVTKIDIVVDDKYVLNEEKLLVENGEYSYEYKFNSARENRKLEVVGYNNQGQEIKRKSINFSVVDDRKYVIKNVPYFNQLRNNYKPYSTCQNTAMAMVLGYYGWGGTPDDIYLSYKKDAKSAVKFEDIFNFYASKYNFPVRIQTFWKRSQEDLEMRIRQGRPVVLHGRFTGSGHVVVLVGYDENYFYINDPAGQWNQRVSGGYDYNKYINDGKYVKYKKKNVMAALHNYPTVFTHEIVPKASYSRNRYIPNFVKSLKDFE